jgi:hypothetical protein
MANGRVVAATEREEFTTQAAANARCEELSEDDDVISCTVTSEMQGGVTKWIVTTEIERQL